MASAVSRSLGTCRTLVLDRSYRPMEVVTWQRALVLDLGRKVQVLEYYDDVCVRSERDVFFVPAVMVAMRCLRSQVVSSERAALNKRNVFLRDGYECQYCGSQKQLTIDHVVPVSKGGGSTWENLVTACAHCNGKKGNKMLNKSGMKLRKVPKEPSGNTLLWQMQQREIMGNTPQEWMDYIF
mmetsp:Transcript_1692/g.10405  ORF Transcript_1692/g.10405 Transcript_1692/m.10405 type:complete len:182 (-) Transcript_1692:1882-2427(-)